MEDGSRPSSPPIRRKASPPISIRPPPLAGPARGGAIAPCSHFGCPRRHYARVLSGLYRLGDDRIASSGFWLTGRCPLAFARPTSRSRRRIVGDARPLLGRLAREGLSAVLSGRIDTEPCPRIAAVRVVVPDLQPLTGRLSGSANEDGQRHIAGRLFLARRLQLSEAERIASGISRPPASQGAIVSAVPLPSLGDPADRRPFQGEPAVRHQGNSMGDVAMVFPSLARPAWERSVRQSFGGKE